MEILSAILHIFIYVKIHFYKKQGNGLEPETENSASKLDAEALSSFGLNLLIIVSLGSTTYFTSKTGNLEPEQINLHPNYLIIYYNNFFTPGFTCILVIILTYKRNKNLRKSVLNEVKNLWYNLIERL